MISRLLSPVLVVLAAIIPAAAQEWPSKTVTLVVPFTPAGSTDLLARIAAQVWEQRIGRPFVVENRPGASQQVGVNAVAKAAPDGQTLLMATSSAMAVNPTLYKKIAYDPVRNGFVLLSIPKDKVMSRQATSNLVYDSRRDLVWSLCGGQKIRVLRIDPKTLKITRKTVLPQPKSRKGKKSRKSTAQRIAD